MTELGHWRTFLAIHRTGSLTAAARVLGLSQPSVTAQLQSLERSLGRPLFERRARGVVATPFADQVAARLAGPFDTLAHVIGEVRGDRDVAEAPVRLGGPAEFLAEVGAPAVAALVADGVRVHVTPGLSDVLLDEARLGRLDLAVSTRRPRGRTLLAEPLADEEFVLVGAPGLPVGATEVAERGAAALAAVPLLAYAADVPILRRYWRHVFGIRLDADPALTLPDLRALRAAVVAGAGVTVLPRYLCDGELAAGRLRVLLETDDPPINTTFLVRPPATAGRPHVERVRQALLDATARWR